MISNNKRVKEVIDIMDSNGVGRGKERLADIIDKIYLDVDFTDKVVLDVGSGEGVLSFPPAVLGAKKVVALEPELDGSSEGFNDRFESVAKNLNVENTVLKRTTLQDYDYSDGPFDIIVMYNVINHLDEPACVALHNDDDAKQKFKLIFEEIYKNMNDGSLLIVSDCARRNFFGDLGLTNPVAKTIEWEKHQSPQLWISELEKVGFNEMSTEWNSLFSLRLFKPVLRNAVAAYLTNSHFIFRVVK
jgi:cyclopropane fatty-acyl-phospholipid synthase-like methyltransferase